uniref:Uncharacterized protein n=1 Tax=Arundo donax TaxID=35708 RepID=A0A0A9BMS2_ARUDO
MSKINPTHPSFKLEKSLMIYQRLTTRAWNNIVVELISLNSNVDTHHQNCQSCNLSTRNFFGSVQSYFT